MAHPEMKSPLAVARLFESFTAEGLKTVAETFWETQMGAAGDAQVATEDGDFQTARRLKQDAEFAASVADHLETMAEAAS